MSLKVFHVIFIILSILLAIVCAWWSFSNGVALPFGIVSALTAVGLVIYGVWFVRKSRTIIT